MRSFRQADILKLTIEQVPVATVVAGELVLFAGHLQAGAAGRTLEVDKIGRRRSMFWHDASPIEDKSLPGFAARMGRV
jgi:hypothetical protein